MYNYKGITPETVDLLAINRFNDSKPFYEEHKQEIKDGATIPMRQIILDMSDLMYEIDPLVDMNPIYVVSRIRRDTRRSKDKMMYRDNLWLMMRRNKAAYPFAPFYWFEFSPMGYMYGIGMWTAKPLQLDYVRGLILEQPERWLEAVKATENAGLNFNVKQFYKKDKVPNAPDNLKQYLNAKYMEFSYWNDNLENIGSTKLIDELRLMVDISSPMYKFLIEAYDKAVSEGVINADDYKR